jgi:hypothetical protein
MGPGFGSWPGTRVCEWGGGGSLKYRRRQPTNSCPPGKRKKNYGVPSVFDDKAGNPQSCSLSPVRTVAAAASLKRREMIMRGPTQERHLRTKFFFLSRSRIWKNKLGYFGVFHCQYFALSNEVPGRRGAC